MSANTPILSVRDLRKHYTTVEGTLPVLQGVSLDVAAGESVALTGESGSGKSTLLHCIGCLDQADSGTIHLGAHALENLDDKARADMRKDRISVVFQQLNLIPSLNVRQNLSFQARLTGRLDETWLDELTTRLGLAGLLARFPEELSGGQQQRVAIGRAIAHRPALVLADEPTGNLDEDTSAEVLQLLLDLIRDSNAGLLMVTHSQALAKRLDRHIHLTHGQIT